MAIFVLQHGQTWKPPLAAWDPGQVAVRLADTIEGWRSCSAIHQAYEWPWRDLVHHSGRVLQALTFQPTGAIGGVRNWDYRYTWVRDASLTMAALWAAACSAEANKRPLRDEIFTLLTAPTAREARRRCARTGRRCR
jgi:hypothetical protein